MIFRPCRCLKVMQDASTYSIERHIEVDFGVARPRPTLSSGRSRHDLALGGRSGAWSRLFRNHRLSRKEQERNCQWTLRSNNWSKDQYVLSHWRQSKCHPVAFETVGLFCDMTEREPKLRDRTEDDSGWSHGHPPTAVGLFDSRAHRATPRVGL